MECFIVVYVAFMNQNSMDSKQIYKITAILTPNGLEVQIKRHDSNRVSVDQIRFITETEDKICVMKYCIDGHQGASKEILITHILNKLLLRKQKIEGMLTKIYKRRSCHNTRYITTKILKS
jgi:hypothetical protein